MSTKKGRRFTTERETTGDWSSWRWKEWRFIEDDDVWQLFEYDPEWGDNQHPLQIIKAPKRGTRYAEYWPDKSRAQLISASVDMFHTIERFMMYMLNTRDGDPHEWPPNESELFYEAREAYHKALGIDDAPPEDTQQ